MYCEKLRLIHIRNLDDKTIEPGKGLTFIAGPNGCGKTNLIEAIYYSSVGKSFRTANDNDMIRLGAEEGSILLTYRVHQTSHVLKIRMVRGQGKKFYLNDTPIRRKELLGLFRTVLFTPDELQAAVRNADRASLRSSARVISFFSPKGKSGKTTLISNLAASIAKKTGEPVAILDCDLQFGDMAVFFNLNPQTTLVEAVRDIKFLSPVTLKSYFIDARRNLQVLCGPAKPDLAESVTLDALTQLIHMTRSLYSYVLIDLPSGFSDISATACELSDETVLMAMYNGGYETMHMKRALEIFKAWDNYRERIHPLFTRVSPFDDAEKERLSKELGYPVAAIIPNEYVRVSEAADNGRLVVDEDPDSPFAKAVDALAEKIISK